MARQHGRNARLYMNITSGGTAEPVAFLRQWSISFATDNVEVTSMGDSNKVYVAGLPDASGSYSGFYDDTTAQMYTAGTDGVARKFYLYPSTGSTAQYFFGTALFDFSLDSSVDGANTISGDFQAASLVSKVG